ncbi:MAG TPA: prepilin-type N-terminal cleavage/methylation domain-containing protein [Fimbriimonadaceae bacterium]|nr:prepilin-type N-terminal cleavage/methylation domain-containing protein [Fimbriimonadaceae bacterium]HRJ31925.1 prepilin-type N-terminal cleavage/methylation domain-containing protein [Fimbriimonadaceae bacterium]
MKSYRRAFTLIELLVVIAIIAILAAILFPVFARAKVMAKGAASISNMKQIGISHMMYMADYEDRAVLVGTTNEADSPFLLNGVPYKPWSWLLWPYMKNANIQQDPLRSAEPVNVAGANQQIFWAYRNHYGYAFTVYSPTLFTTGGWQVNTIKSTTIGQPASTVMFSLKKGRNNQADWLWVNSPVWMANLVAPPHCGSGDYTTVNPVSICAPAVRWGSNGYTSEIPPIVEGRHTGGNAFRKNNQHIVCMGDGHVKGMASPQLAAGTNWTPTTPSGSITITDINRYMWDND